ncbi:MAG: hypothetical protein WC986_14600 [Elusimicrobiota bacterium]|jgi:hypothetical protein
MRINGIVVQDPNPGRYYLLRREPEQGSPSYHLRDEPGRTNQSHAERHSGWLGSTNNVSWFAEEAIELHEVNGRWQYKRLPASELVESEEAEEVTAG